ncbi:hypothetical protein FB45DRAFT_907603 [Roridomyces roridus]|uniref:Uncharacterized protein n=1 Tax=Roridomyces roridus TaxID=1738132 RepID=A0AAD7C1Z8_9AGAR|nr:hypothetical protein FB45DRAFT_907603 [Roridomyces roridus]
MDSNWSNVPAELVHEITSYNADDMPTLRAMSLVSKTTRSFATIHLFSMVHFSCVEDFPWWLEMLNRTPDLASHVKKVKFSGDRSQQSMDRLGLTSSVTRLSNSSIIPVLPSLPNVTSVELGEWNNGSIPIAMLMTQMSLCPHIRELRLAHVDFYYYTQLVAIIGACGGTLRSLSFERVLLKRHHFSSDSESDSDSESEVEPSSPPAYDSDVPDLSALEELTLEECNGYPGFDGSLISRLITEHQPSGVRTLTLGYSYQYQFEACSVSATETLLCLCAPAVVNLSLDPDIDTEYAEEDIVDMFRRLPAFLALETLTIWLHPDHMAQQFIDALKGAPKLTKLVFRVWLHSEDYDQDRQDFNQIVNNIFPWGGPDSMKTVITRKFPLCREVVFHLCVSRVSVTHFRRGVRRRMERQLKERLKKTRADIAAYLRIEWLDEDFRPVVYRKTDGKPLWSPERNGVKNGSESDSEDDGKIGWESEPDTEDSDCESESEGNEYDW